jgi:hypothetical protein
MTNLSNSNNLSDEDGRERDFDGLATAADELLQAGKLRTVRSGGQETVRTYWELGFAAQNHVGEGLIERGVRSRVVAFLASHTGLRQRLIYDILDFPRKFPVLRGRSGRRGETLFSPYPLPSGRGGTGRAGNSYWLVWMGGRYVLTRIGRW